MLAKGDVAQDADCRRVAQIALDSWGRIDALVNNAGTTKFADHADLEALSADDFLRIYQVNVVGAYQMARACAPALKAAAGAIVNVSSVAGKSGGGSSMAYAASKGALLTLTLSLAKSLAPRIRVNAVCPGLIDTPWTREGYGERYPILEQRYLQGSALGRVGTPKDVAGVVLFLIGDAARFVTGQTIWVDGGVFTRAPWPAYREIVLNRPKQANTLSRALIQQWRHLTQSMARGGLLNLIFGFGA